MLRPLIINRDFLFDHSPGGECLRAFVRAMDSSKWNPIIYASDGYPLVNGDFAGTKLVHETKCVRYVAAAMRRVLIPDLTWLPGYEWQAWGRRTSKKVINDIRSRSISPDFIHSISYPIASHWDALKIKKKTGLPWVMQFYDPWADNPYRPFKTKFLKQKDWEMERECVYAADLIIHDNYNIAKIWRDRYGEEIGRKIQVLPLTVPLPKANVLPITRTNGQPLVISHIGNFMLNRKAAPFIKAVLGLLDKYPQFRELIKVNFIGKVTEEDKVLIKHNDLDDVFVLHGTLSASDCEFFYKKTDLFLAVDGVNPDNVFFPSKILKYFYFSRPILGITPKGSVMDRELSNSGHAHYSEDALSDIVDFLYRAITDYKSICQFNMDYWHRFEPKSVIEEYEALVKRIL